MFEKSNRSKILAACNSYARIYIYTGLCGLYRVYYPTAAQKKGGLFQTHFSDINIVREQDVVEDGTTLDLPQVEADGA